jgi:peptidoglycan-associated lipoprotein
MKKAAFAGLAMAGIAISGCGSTRDLFMDRTEVVATPSACGPMRFEIYFADGEARLTEPARQAIGMTAGMLQNCDIRAVQVIGLADARGASTVNQALSERRARTVAEALTGAGWPAPSFEVSALGDEGAADEQGVREPLRRRTEVLVEAAPWP